MSLQTHNWEAPISRPHGRAMGCLLWGFLNFKKCDHFITAPYCMEIWNIEVSRYVPRSRDNYEWRPQLSSVRSWPRTPYCYICKRSGPWYGTHGQIPRSTLFGFGVLLRLLLLGTNSIHIRWGHNAIKLHLRQWNHCEWYGSHGCIVRNVSKIKCPLVYLTQFGIDIRLCFSSNLKTLRLE